MNIGLIAHDAKKRCFRTCVSPTARYLPSILFTQPDFRPSGRRGNRTYVRKYLAGHVGGVQQMGSQIEQNDLDLVIFLRDRNSRNSMSRDVHRIIRLCDVHSIPLATNLATAEMLIKSLDRGEWTGVKSTGETTNTTEKNRNCL